MSEFIWEEPPAPAPGGRGRKSAFFTDEVQEALKSNPGRWMLVIKEATASNVSNAQAWVKKREGFEMTSRTVEERKNTKTPYSVYARFDPSGLSE